MRSWWSLLDNAWISERLIFRYHWSSLHSQTKAARETDALHDHCTSACLSKKKKNFYDFSKTPICTKDVYFLDYTTEVMEQCDCPMR